MKNFKLISAIAAGAILLGAAYQASAADYADIVFIVDESGSMSGEHAWLSGMVTSLESGLQSKGIGTVSNANQYALVGYGTSLHGGGSNQVGHQHDVGVAGSQWGSASQLATATSGLVTNGGTEDGYEAINYFFNNYSFRSGAALNVVLVTDEDRDIVASSLNYQNILSYFERYNALLNVVVSASFTAVDQGSLLGVDSDQNGYKADGNGNYTLITGSILTTSNDGNTVTDYVDLAWATGGAAWNIAQLRAGGLTADSFTKAFIDIKTGEIEQQPPSSEVPEPSTIFLFSAGLAGIIGYGRKIKKAI